MRGWGMVGGREDRKPTPIRESTSCQPITRVTASRAELSGDGALGCQGSTKSEGDKGGKAFTTSAAETFVTHDKGNMAALPRPNPHLTGDRL